MGCPSNTSDYSPQDQMNNCSALSDDRQELGTPTLELEPDEPRLAAAYVCVLLFCAAYFFRPAEFIPALAVVPFAKIAGVLAGCTLLVAFLTGKARLKAETKLLIMLFGYLCLTIPFSSWPGGSFRIVVLEFGKVLVVATATALAVTTVKRLRRLMLLQTLAMLAMCVAAAGAGRHNDNAGFGRMYGVGSLFADPNDFALNLCIVLPFCVSLLMTCRRWFAKVFWIAAIALVLFSIISTYSRGGFLALIVVMFAIWRRFRVNSRVAIPILLLVIAATATSIALIGHSYLDRMSTITNPQGEGSAQARKALLLRSVELSVQHPLFGVGPGQFTEFSGDWHETHNTYTQLSAEAGMPSLALFLALIWLTLRNLRAAGRVPFNPQYSYLVGGLYCGLGGYIVGAFFLSTAYQIYPYLLMAYASAAATIREDRTVAEIDYTESVP